MGCDVCQKQIDNDCWLSLNKRVVCIECSEDEWDAQAQRIAELEQQLSYQTDRAESFCTRLHEEEQRNAELRQRCETMAAYLRTHDHRLHDAAMAAREQEQAK